MNEPIKNRLKWHTTQQLNEEYHVYDHSEMLAQPCNENEFDFTWDNIKIRVVIQREYFKDTDHVEIYCSKPNKYTETAYKSHFFRKYFTEEEIKTHLLNALGDEPLQQSLI